MSPRKSPSEMIKEINQAGGCSHPIRLRGEFVNTNTGEVNQRPLMVACKDRRAVICPSCSYLYKADAWILVSAGLIGGKGVPESVREHPRLFLTLTAPSFGAVHARRTDGSCRSRPQPPCPHGRSLQCHVRHDEKDLKIGSPLCDACFDYVGAILWNAEASRLWNRTLEQIRRRLAARLAPGGGDNPQGFRLNYLKVAEFQRRGLVHFHVVLRLDGAGEAFSPPPSELTTETLSMAIADVVRQFSINTSHGESAWGRQFDLSDASTLDRGDLRIAGYLAKYATKSTDGTKDFARSFRARSNITSIQGSSHLRQLALTAWDLALEPEFETLNLRAHAHAFGHRGQLITKSRHYSTKFLDLRAARAAYMARESTGDPMSGTFVFEGRGYDDPHTVEVAEFLHWLSLEAKRSAPRRDADVGGDQ